MCFSLVVSCYYGNYEHNTSPEAYRDNVKCLMIAEIALAIIFSIIAFIAFSGLMPLGVGIAFIVWACVNLLIIKVIKIYHDKLEANKVRHNNWLLSIGSNA